VLCTESRLAIGIVDGLCFDAVRVNGILSSIHLNLQHVLKSC